MKTKIDILSNRPYLLFYLSNFLGFLSLFIINLRIGVIISVVSVLLLIIQANHINKILKSCNNLPFVLFFLFEILSFINYFLNDYSRGVLQSNPEVILHAINYILIPQFVFFLSGLLISNTSSNINNNIKHIIFANAFLLSTGLFFYIFKPPTYINYIQRIHPEEFEMFNSFVPRMQSYFNSMVIGNISVISFLLTLKYFKRSKIKTLLLILFLVSTIISMQRSAWVTLPLALFVYYLNTGLKISRKIMINNKTIITSLFSLGALMFIFNYIVNNNSFFVEFISTRFSMLFSGPSERLDQWGIGFEIAKEYPFGIGTGMLTHKAYNLNLQYSIPDGNYFRIMGEIGYLGFFMFLTMLTTSGYYLLKCKSYMLFSILVVFSLQAIGTNVFDLFYSGFVFWLIIGIAHGISNNKYTNT